MSPAAGGAAQDQPMPAQRRGRRRVDTFALYPVEACSGYGQWQESRTQAGRQTRRAAQKGAKMVAGERRHRRRPPFPPLGRRRRESRRELYRPPQEDRPARSIDRARGAATGPATGRSWSARTRHGRPDPPGRRPPPRRAPARRAGSALRRFPRNSLPASSCRALDRRRGRRHAPPAWPRTRQPAGNRRRSRKSARQRRDCRSTVRLRSHRATIADGFRPATARGPDRAPGPSRH